MRIRMCFDDVAWERSEAIQDAWIHELFKEETLMAIAYDDLVPFVLHWGTKEESPLGLGPLIIMEYIDHVMDLSDVLNTPGVAIKDCPILDPNIDEAKLELLYGQFADILLQLSTLRLPRIGSLAQIDDFTWEVARRPLSYNANELARLGTLPRSRLPKANETFQSASSYSNMLADLHLEHLTHQRNDAVDRSGAGG
ncbi:hypothetical protein LV164_003357 [Aspergillus fumigatus]|nr:hypothetical protein KXX13_003433 [Aspergillus fumigatus]KAH1488130.1 hypothetical protein KXX42_002493 [Aspergillus fumigatus]KAH1520565.1 hypothetical protein KXX29_004591 [Aspergillus fumigatus]KAH1525948.1 hypothetical protein KXX18_003217 [Aspergillus fumigatus]KAH1622903.1 hypothetical protein KXX21_007523 [Aspergillus fumigatus]